jgi:RimJ/RimL family protein N-acetyltransferase
MRNEFQIELGYCFTLPDKTGQGYSSTITKMLLDKVRSENLMASTELRSDNSMIRILERNGFKQYGKPWKSGIHKGTLGLYLKFAK